MARRQRPDTDTSPEVRRLMTRRRFVQMATAGTAIATIGGILYVAIDDDLTEQYRGETLDDGRPRLPPGQRVIKQLKYMGGEEGDPDPADWRLRVHGEVERPFAIDFRELLAMPQTEGSFDVHCVTSWSVMGAQWRGVRVADLAERAGLKTTARHVIFEAAHGYTANVPLVEALAPEVLIAHEHEDSPLAHLHGGPARALVPALYFWKSAKWIEGIKFAEFDEPGYWETRGYHNHADPWKEERYS